MPKVVAEDPDPWGGLEPVVATVDATVHDIAFSPDGRLLAMASEDGTVRVWDAGTLRLRHSLEVIPERGPDTHNIVHSYHGGPVTEEQIRNRQVFTLAITPDSRRLVAGGGDCTPRIYDLNRGELELALDPLGGRIESLAISPDGTRLAAAAVGGVGYFNTEDGGHVSPQRVGRCLAEHASQVWSLPGGEPRGPLAGHAGSFYGQSLVFSADGTLLALFGDESVIRAWSPETLEPVSAASPPKERHLFSQLAFLPDGRRAIATSSDRKLQIWDFESGEVLAETDLRPSANDLALSPDGQRVALSTHEGAILIFDTDRLRLETQIDDAARGLGCVCFSPDGQLLATGSSGNVVKVWRHKSKELVATLFALEDNQFITLRADGRIVLSSGARGQLEFLDGAVRVPLTAARERLPAKVKLEVVAR